MTSLSRLQHHQPTRVRESAPPQRAEAPRAAERTEAEPERRTRPDGAAGGSARRSGQVRDADQRRTLEASLPARAGEKKRADSPELARFKDNAKEKGREVWQQFRRTAVAMFGDGVLQPVKGTPHTRLQLSHAQLRQVANHPERVERTIRALRETGTVDGEGLPGPEASARYYARAAKDALHPPRESITVATVNDDFTDRKSNLRRVDADVMLVQEAKNTDVRELMPEKKFGVHQGKREDKAGSAVVWNRDEAKVTDRGYELGVEPRGAGMLRRWISWTDMKVGDEKVRMISVHRPPQRFSHLWPAFDRNLARFIKRTKGPVIVGMDANERTPESLERLTGLKWHAPRGSIDGFLVSPGIKVEDMRRLPKGSSDHHPVKARFTLPR